MNYENRMGVPIYLSERVQELLNEGTLTEIIKLIEADLKDSWIATPTTDQAARESYYYQLHALGLLRIKMETLVNNLRFQRND